MIPQVLIWIQMLKYVRNFQKKLCKDLFYFATNRLEILYVVHQVWIFIPSNYVDIKICDIFKDCLYLQYCILFLLCSFESKVKSKSQNSSNNFILHKTHIEARDEAHMVGPIHSALWQQTIYFFTLKKKPPILLHIRENN